jgi:hypothetical protein
MAKYFADPWNPEPDEIRAWAYDADAMCPEQDFDLALSWAGHEKAYLELAQHEACPKRRFFLGVLYLMVGDAVRTRFHVAPEPVVRGLIEHGNDYDHPEIRLWQERSRALLANRDLFDYDLWCGGGYARGTEA